jgi:hypothetical protein
MIDFADLILPGGAKSQSNARLTKMSVNVLVFALGCGAAALSLHAVSNVVFRAATDCGRAIAGCAHRGAGGSMIRPDCRTHAPGLGAFLAARAAKLLAAA